jgi:copper(I)-binding protein
LKKECIVTHKAWIRGAAASALAGLLAAGQPVLAAPQVEAAWARPTAKGQPAGGGYLRIDNKGGAADRLLGASAGAAAASVELHSMSMDGDVMRMRRVDAIDVPAGGTVELKPGGLHLMLMGLTAPLEPHTVVPLTLRFEKAGEVQVQMKVAPKPAGEPKMHDDHAGHGDHAGHSK